MKHKWIIITISVLFFLTALTFYVNKVIFPTVVKKIAIEQAQTFLKRKVEIESVHFNWLKGVVINNLKVYQKDSSSEVFAQAEKVSVGLLFIPGKPAKLILPSVIVQSPSLHLIHQQDGQWNFSDLLVPAPPSATPSPVEVSVGGITIVDGKVRLDDLRANGLWTELIDQMNLKVGLSVQGISFDGSLNLPQKQGSLAVDGSYWPLNQSLKASVKVKNLQPLEYLGFIPAPLPLTITSGVINDIDARIEYDPKRIDVRGRWSLKNIDVTYEKQNFKSDMDASDVHITADKSIAVKGHYSFDHTQITLPSLSASGNIQAEIGEFLMNAPDDISLKSSSLKNSKINVQLPKDQNFQAELNAKINAASWQKDSAFLDGDFSLGQLFAALDNERTFKGDLKLSHIKVNKDKDINASGEISLPSFDVRLPGQVIKGSLITQPLTLSMDEQNNIKANGPLELTGLDYSSDTLKGTGSLHLRTAKVSFNQNDQVLEVQTQGRLDEAEASLKGQGTLSTHASFDAHVLFPLKDPSGLQYNGSLALVDTTYEGLVIGPVSDISLSMDFTTNRADIQHLSLTVLDTNIKSSGHVTDFLKPRLNIDASSDRIDLSKIKDVAPDLLKTYGLSIDGETSFKLHFEGLASDPLSGQITAVASLKNVNVESSTLKQKFNAISGTLNADGDSLSWNNFTATILDHPLTSEGQLSDFKNPHIKASLSWQDLEVKTTISKKDNIVSIKDLSGHYLSAGFNFNGLVDLTEQAPQVDVKGNMKLKLEDLALYAPNLKTTVEPLKLSGTVAIVSSLKGPVSDWKKCELTTTAQSDIVTAAGFKFNNFNIDINEESGKLKKFNITSNLYDGNLNILTTADLTDPDFPFETALHVEGVNLAKLKNDTGAKDEDLRGFIALTSMVNGTVKDIMKIKGNGALNISQGYLMKKEFSSLFMIPEMSNLVFTDATANFNIADQKVSTQNFMLKSEGATVNGVGWIGFDHKLQFELHPEFNTDTIAQSDSLRKGPSALIAMAAGKYLTFTIEGTLEKPIVHTIKKPTELIKKTGEILKENVGDILQGIFQ